MKQSHSELLSYYGFWNSVPREGMGVTPYKTIESDATFYQLDGKYPAINSIYRAITVAKDNHVFRVEIGRGLDGKGIARLTAEKGDYGYFK